MNRVTGEVECKISPTGAKGDYAMSKVTVVYSRDWGENFEGIDQFNWDLYEAEITKIVRVEVPGAEVEIRTDYQGRITIDPDEFPDAVDEIWAAIDDIPIHEDRFYAAI
jgi:hypothetical protein